MFFGIMNCIKIQEANHLKYSRNRVFQNYYISSVMKYTQAQL